MFINYSDIEEIKKKCVTDDEKETKKIHKALDKLKWKYADGYCLSKKGWIFILIKDFKGTPTCYNTLSHEIEHASDFSGAFIGMKRSKKTREYFAYITGFISQEIHKKLKHKNYVKSNL